MDNVLIKFYTGNDRSNYNFGTYDPKHPLNPYIPPEKKFKGIELPAPNYNNTIRPLSNKIIPPKKNLPIIRTIYNKPNNYDSIELSKSYTIPLKRDNDKKVFQRIGNIISSQELLKMQMLEDKIKDLELQNENENKEYKRVLEQTIKENKRKQPTIIPNYRNVNFNEEIFLNGVNDNFILSPIPIHGNSIDDIKELRRRQVKNELRNARNKIYNDDSESEINSRNMSRTNSQSNSENNRNNKMLNYIEFSFNNMRKDMENKLNNLEQKQIDDYNYLRQLLLEQLREKESEESVNSKKSEKSEKSESSSKKISEISSQIYFMNPIIEISNGSSYSKSSKQPSNLLSSFHASDESKSKNRKHYISNYYNINQKDLNNNSKKSSSLNYSMKNNRNENNFYEKAFSFNDEDNKSKNKEHVLPNLKTHNEYTNYNTLPYNQENSQNLNENNSQNYTIENNNYEKAISFNDEDDKSKNKAHVVPILNKQKNYPNYNSSPYNNENLPNYNNINENISPNYNVENNENNNHLSFYDEDDISKNKAHVVPILKTQKNYPNYNTSPYNNDNLQNYINNINENNSPINNSNYGNYPPNYNSNYGSYSPNYNFGNNQNY